MPWAKYKSNIYKYFSLVLPLWVEFFTLWSGTSFCGPKLSTLKFQRYVPCSCIFRVLFVGLCKHSVNTAHWRLWCRSDQRSDWMAGYSQKDCARDWGLAKPLFIQSSPWDIDLNYISSPFSFSSQLLCLFTSYHNITKEVVYSLSSAIENFFFCHLCSSLPEITYLTGDKCGSKNFETLKGHVIPNLQLENWVTLDMWFPHSKKLSRTQLQREFRSD